MIVPHTDTRTETYERHRAELVNYAARLVLRDGVAEELAQDAAVRLLQTDSLPDDPCQIRAWPFRVVTNLALDHLRRRSTWKEMVLIDTRGHAESDPGFVAQSMRMRGTPEMSAIAREHLAVCWGVTPTSDGTTVPAIGAASPRARRSP